MSERYIPTTLRRLLTAMIEPWYDWLGSPLDGGLEYDEKMKSEIEEKYGIQISTHRSGYNYIQQQPIYTVTVIKGEQNVSFGSSQEIPKKWPIRLRLKKQPKNKE